MRHGLRKSFWTLPGEMVKPLKRLPSHLLLLSSRYRGWLRQRLRSEKRDLGALEKAHGERLEEQYAEPVPSR